MKDEYKKSKQRSTAESSGLTENKSHDYSLQKLRDLVTNRHTGTLELFIKGVEIKILDENAVAAMYKDFSRINVIVNCIIGIGWVLYQFLILKRSMCECFRQALLIYMEIIEVIAVNKTMVSQILQVCTTSQKLTMNVYSLQDILDVLHNNVSVPYNILLKSISDGLLKEMITATSLSNAGVLCKTAKVITKNVANLKRMSYEGDINSLRCIEEMSPNAAPVYENIQHATPNDVVSTFSLELLSSYKAENEHITTNVAEGVRILTSKCIEETSPNAAPVYENIQHATPNDVVSTPSHQIIDTQSQSTSTDPLVFHTIICIDTSKSMNTPWLLPTPTIQRLLQEIPETSEHFKEIISVVCFGRKVLYHAYTQRDPTSHRTFINEIENDEGSWIGCTPLCEALKKCMDVHNIVTERIGRSRIVHGRIIMFTDGKPTSTTERPTIVEDNFNDLEPANTINDNLAIQLETLGHANLPIFPIITSYEETYQPFLVTMCVLTNGKVIHEHQIDTFAKFLNIEITAKRLRPQCRSRDQDKIFAFLVSKLPHEDILVYEYATETIMKLNGDRYKEAFLSGLIRRPPKEAIITWQEISAENIWTSFPDELNKKIEKEYNYSTKRKLKTFTIQQKRNNGEVETLRFDIKKWTYRVIGRDNATYHVKRKFMCNDWG